MTDGKLSSSKLRRQIAWEAARLIYFQEESDASRAKQRAAQRICRGRALASVLPGDAEIRDEVQAFSRLQETTNESAALREMRLVALRLMRLLAQFRPRLIGGVLSGQVTAGASIQLHLFANRIEPIV